MQEIFFNKNYQNNNFNIEVLNKKNFTLFKIENFLDQNTYEFIDKAFPKLDNEKFKTYDLEKYHNKYTINSTDDYYNKLLVQNTELQLIHDTIFSKKFFNYFYENLKKNFFLSRSKDLKFFYKLLRPKTLNISESYIKKLFFTYIRRHIEYSYIFDGGFVAPHTDSRSKLLSLILFFPEGRDGEKDIGTTFWISDKKNLKNQHLTNSEDVKKFKENSDVLTKLDFKKCDLFGFIRTSQSWHSVEPFDLGKDYIRRSIIINFYF